MSSVFLHENKRVLLLLVILFISPLFSLPFILIEVYNQRKYALFFVSLFMVIFSYVFPWDYGDSGRNFTQYFLNSNNLSFNDFLKLNINGSDFIVQFLCYIARKLLLPYEVVKVVIVFISYQITFYIFKKIVRNNCILKSSKRYYFQAFLVAWMGLPFIMLVSGMRFYFAAAFFMLSYFCINNLHKKTRGYIFAILSICTHFSFIVLLPVIYVYKKINIKFFSVIVIVITFFVSTIMPLLIESVSRDILILDKLYRYTNNGGSGLVERISVRGIIALWLEMLPVFMAIGIVALEAKRNIEKYRMFIIIILLSVIFSSFFLIFQRYMMLSSLIFIISLLSNIDNRRKNIVYIQSMILSLIMASCFNIYGIRQHYFKRDIYEIVLPIPYIIFTPYNERYSIENMQG